MGLKPLRLLPVFVLSAGLWGATTTASVVRIGGESGGACTQTQTDSTTASCHAAFANGTGTSISSTWQPDASRYIWFGSLHRTGSTSSPTIQSRARIAFSSEFAAINSSGHGVRITYDLTGIADLEAVAIYANDGYGNHPLVGTLHGGDSLTVEYAGHPIDLILEAVTPQETAADYVSLFHVELVIY